MAKPTKKKGRTGPSATPRELERENERRRLRANIRREQDIQRSARRLERLTERTDVALLELAKSIVGPDFAIVPTTSERATGPE